jgi:hypothetical protein
MMMFRKRGAGIMVLMIIKSSQCGGTHQVLCQGWIVGARARSTRALLLPLHCSARNCLGRVRQETLTSTRWRARADVARRCAQHGACGQIPDGPSRLAPGLGAFFAPPASRASGRPNLRLRGGSRPKDGGQGDASQEETLGGWSPEEDATKEAKEAWAETRCSALLLCTSLPASTQAALGTAACVYGRVIYGCLVSQSVAEADRGGGAENGPRPSRLDAKHYRLGEVLPASCHCLAFDRYK